MQSLAPVLLFGESSDPAAFFHWPLVMTFGRPGRPVAIGGVSEAAQVADDNDKGERRATFLSRLQSRLVVSAMTKR